MSTTNIQLLRSNIASKRPAAAVLLDGQVAVNYNHVEPGLFFRLTNGRLTKVGPVAYSNDGSFPNAVPAGEPGNVTGEQWLDGRISYDSPVLKVYDGNQWVTSSGFTVNDATGNFAIDRDIECNNLKAEGLSLTGSLILDNDIRPSNNCTVNLGSNAERFLTGWMCYGDVKENLTVGGDIVGTDLILTGDIIARNLTTNGNNILGSGASSLTKVDSKAQFEYSVEAKAGLVVHFGTTVQDLQVTGGTLIGTNCSQNLTVKATSVFDCPVTFNSTVKFPQTPISNPIFDGNIVLGQDCLTDTLSVTAVSTFDCSSTFNGSSTFNSAVELKGTTTISGNVLASPDNAVDLGSPTNRFANIYTGDLHLANERGDWTMVEEEDFLTLRNNKTGKTFKIVMEALG